MCYFPYILCLPEVNDNMVINLGEFHWHPNIFEEKYILQDYNMVELPWHPSLSEILQDDNLGEFPGHPGLPTPSLQLQLHPSGKGHLSIELYRLLKTTCILVLVCIRFIKLFNWIQFLTVCYTGIRNKFFGGCLGN